MHKNTKKKDWQAGEFLSVTFTICTYNGAARIAGVLKAISNLKNLARYDYDIIVVDNSSGDDVSEIAKNALDSYSLKGKVLFEAKKGKSYALKCALNRTKSEIVIIVDDDNYLPPEYLERIEEKFRSDVKVAYIGVSTYLKCDVTPPEWFKEQSKFFAVGDLYEFSGVLRSGPVSVWGAGMAFRRCVWDQAYLSYVSPLVGRNSENLIAGEDSELCFLAQLFGYHGYYFNDIALGHFMTQERLTEEYLWRLRWSQGAGGILNRVLADEFAIRTGTASWLRLVFYRSRLPQLAYFRIKIVLCWLKSIFTISKVKKVSARGTMCAYSGCYDIMKNMTVKSLWSSRLGTREL